MDLYIFIFYMDRERGRFEPWLSAVLVVVGQSVNVFPPKLHAHVSVEAGERNVEAERIDSPLAVARGQHCVHRMVVHSDTMHVPCVYVLSVLRGSGEAFYSDTAYCTYHTENSRGDIHGLLYI